MQKKYFVLFTSLLVFASAYLIEFLDHVPRHIPKTLFFDIYTFVLFILGIIYFAICQLEIDEKQAKLINSCILYTLAFPLLLVGSILLDVAFEIQISNWISSSVYVWGINIFIVIQLIASFQLLRFLNKEKDFV